jgi:predicted flap endonuclease-1-like 5' DNA nuclease
VTGYTLLALLALAIGIVVAYRVGARRALRASPAQERPDDGAERPIAIEMRSDATPAARDVDDEATPSTIDARGGAAPSEAPELLQLRAFAEERRRLFEALADARAEVARYRQIVVDIEQHAPPPLLDAPGTPDDLKLIVGVGPVIERMLYQLGIATYRQIARWSERDIDDVDARLPEFPGRIRRDGWVTQARALHQSKYGVPP